MNREKTVKQKKRQQKKNEACVSNTKKYNDIEGTKKSNQSLCSGELTLGC